MKTMFDSSRTYGLFATYFDEELYHFAANYYATQIVYPNRPMYAICAITRVLEDVEISQLNHSPYRDMKHFLEQDFTIIRDIKDDYESMIRDNESTIQRFAPYITARIDAKLVTDKGDFQTMFVSDNRASISKPAWFQKGGVGYLIQSYVGKLKIVAKADVDGKVQLSLRGIDVRTPDDSSKRIPYWIDYTKLTINDKVIFDELTPAWHDKPYVYNLNVKANEEITIEVEWLPHRSDT